MTGSMWSPSHTQPSGSAATARLPDIDDRRIPASRLVRRAVSTSVAMGVVVTSALAIGSCFVTIDITIDASGGLEPRHVAPVRATASGRIAAILVQPGDTVRAGQLVARLDTLDWSATASQIRSQIAAARLTLARDEMALPLDTTRARDDVARAEARLLRARAMLRDQLAAHHPSVHPDSVMRRYVQGTHVAVDVALAEVLAAEVDVRAAHSETRRASVLAMDLERSRGALRRLEAEARTMEERRRRLEVHAPSAGVVLTEALENLSGAVVREGDVIMEVADPSAWRAVTSVSERDVHRIRRGDRVRLEVPALALLRRDRVWGRVEAVAAEPASQGLAPTIASASAGLAVAPVTSSPAPNRYRVLITVASDGEDQPPLEALRRGYAVRARIVTRSTRAIVAVRDYFLERLGGPR